MRLIDADSIQIPHFTLATDRIKMIDAIDEAPTIEPKRGEWKPFDLTWGRSVWYCTACEQSVEVPCDIWTHKPIYNYCPNCGANMNMKKADGERKESE